MNAVGAGCAGAIVFYTWGGFGHAGISLGNGQVMSTHGVDGQRLLISERHGPSVSRR